MWLVETSVRLISYLCDLGAGLRTQKAVPLLEPPSFTREDFLGDGKNFNVSSCVFDCRFGVVITSATAELSGGSTRSSAMKPGLIDAPSEPFSSRRLFEGVVAPSYRPGTGIACGLMYLTAAAGDDEDKGLKTRRV